MMRKSIDKITGRRDNLTGYFIALGHGAFSPGATIYHRSCALGLSILEDK